jgi:hypothetical protein
MAADQKIGAGHAAGMARQGFRELGAALYPESNIAQHPDLGMFPNATPGEIAESRQADTPALEEEHGSSLNDRLDQAKQNRDDRGRDDRGIDRE